MDKLDEIVNLQKGLMSKLNVVSYIPGEDAVGALHPEDYPDLKTIQLQTKDMLFAICCELGEIGDEINWKPWKKTQKAVELDLLRTEMVDVLHFILELMIMWGMTADDIHSYYKAKMQENHDRQERGY